MSYCQEKKNTKNKQTKNENNRNNNRGKNNNSHASSQRQRLFPLCHADPGGGHRRPFPAWSIPPSTKTAPWFSFCPRGLCVMALLCWQGWFQAFWPPRTPQPQVQNPPPSTPTQKAEPQVGNCKTQTVSGKPDANKPRCLLQCSSPASVL